MDFVWLSIYKYKYHFEYVRYGCKGYKAIPRYIFK